MLVTRNPMRLPSSCGWVRLVHRLLLCWHSVMLLLELGLVGIGWVHRKEWLVLVWVVRHCGGTCRSTLGHSEWWLEIG